MKHIASTSVIAFLLVGFVLAPRPVRAAPFRLNQLYTASVPVAQQGSGHLEQGLRQALKKVLVRVTGQRDIAGSPGAGALLDQASSLVSQYGYHSSDMGQELEATFNRPALNQAIRQHNMPLWGRERPRTLLWLVIYRNGQRQLLRRGGAELKAGGLFKGARERGLPLILPRARGHRANTLEAADVTGGFQERIEAASQPYKTQHVAFGQIRPDGGGWQGSMNLMNRGTVVARWRVSGDSADGALQALSNKLADIYAGRYALTTHGQSRRTTMVAVSNIKNLADYAHVSHYLNSLTAVDSAQIMLLKGHTGRFRVTSGSERSALARAIALRARFKRQKRPSSPGKAPTQAAAAATAGSDRPPSAQGGVFSLNPGSAPATPALRYRYQP